MSEVVSAHGSSVQSIFGITVTFPTVLGLSATIGSLGALTTSASGPRLLHRGFRHPRVTNGIGFALVAIAVALVYPTVRTRPVSPIVGILVGGTLAVIASQVTGDRIALAEANTAFGVLAVHHALEGVALAAAFAAGANASLAAAVVLTLHTIAETAVVGGLYTVAGQRRRGLIAIAVM